MIGGVKLNSVGSFSNYFYFLFLIEILSFNNIQMFSYTKQYLYLFVRYIFFECNDVERNKKDLTEHSFLLKLNLQFFSKIMEIYNSITESPNYPKGFTNVQNGCTKNKMKKLKLLDKLREIEPGEWKKVYRDGYDENGEEVSIHYFESRSGKVFNVKTVDEWSNIK